MSEVNYTEQLEKNLINGLSKIKETFEYPVIALSITYGEEGQTYAYITNGGLKDHAIAFEKTKRKALEKLTIQAAIKQYLFRKK